MGHLVKGIKQKASIFEMFHTLWVDINHIGTLLERYQTLALCQINNVTLRFEEM